MLGGVQMGMPLPHTHTLYTPTAYMRPHYDPRKTVQTTTGENWLEGETEDREYSLTQYISLETL